MTDEDLAAHLAGEAGRLLVAQREGSFLEGAALGHAADQVANAFILAALAEWRPDDAILSEESPDDRERLACSRVWIIDPLDGTREYSEGRRRLGGPCRTRHRRRAEDRGGRAAGAGSAVPIRSRGAARFRRRAPENAGQPHPSARGSGGALPLCSARSWCRWDRPAPRRWRSWPASRRPLLPCRRPARMGQLRAGRRRAWRRAPCQPARRQRAGLQSGRYAAFRIW